MIFYGEIDYKNRIIPENDSDYETLKKIRKGTVLKFDVKQERNYEFHKKFFALVSMVFENQNVYTDVVSLRYDLTIASGYYKTHKSFSGEIVKTAKTISFGSMDETEFSELYNKFIDTVIRVFGWDSEMIEDNIEGFL